MGDTSTLTRHEVRTGNVYRWADTGKYVKVTSGNGDYQIIGHPQEKLPKGVNLSDLPFVGTAVEIQMAQVEFLTFLKREYPEVVADDDSDFLGKQGIISLLSEPYGSGTFFSAEKHPILVEVTERFTGNAADTNPELAGFIHFDVLGY